jgi:hypothetical protein
MPDSLFTAQEFDPAKERRRKRLIAAVISAVVILSVLAFIFRYWPYEHLANKFFIALEQKEYKTAYAIWVNNPNWEQNPERYVTQTKWNYPYSKFYEDWGPGSDWGIIQTHHIDGAGTVGSDASGVIVVVTINHRSDPARLWVEKKDKTFSWSSF